MDAAFASPPQALAALRFIANTLICTYHGVMVQEGECVTAEQLGPYVNSLIADGTISLLAEGALAPVPLALALSEDDNA